MNASFFNNKRVLITGAAGFIGSNLAINLVRAGAKVRIIDNLSTGKQANIDELSNNIEFINGDIRDKNTLDAAVKNSEIVFHHAAIASVPLSLKDPLYFDSINNQGTLSLLLAALNSGVNRLVYASSSAVYGDSISGPKEENAPIELLSPYAVSKYGGESYCRLFSHLYDLEVVCLRYFNIFGPRQDPSSQYAAAIPSFISNIVAGDNIAIYGDGEQTRDFCYVDNVVNANLLAGSREGISGETFNIACGESISINELADFLIDKLGKNVKIFRKPARNGDIRESSASISKAKSILGYSPVIDVWDGLNLTIKWFRQNPISL